MNLRRLLAGLLIISASGCASVKPWQRENLARDDMQLVASPSLTSMDDHIYFSKEGASGGRGFAGGGCGCN